MTHYQLVQLYNQIRQRLLARTTRQGSAEWQELLRQLAAVNELIRAYFDAVEERPVLENNF